MTLFSITLIAVAVLLMLAVPGYALIKRRMISEDCISGFSKVLLYVCQPCLAVYTFSSLPLTRENIINIGIFAALSLAVQAIMLGAGFLILYKKSKMPIYRIITIAVAFANCAFFGIPIIEALMPAVASSLIVYTTVYAVIMNLIGWTVGAAIISHDRKYISVKQIFMNPTMLGIVLALIVYFLAIEFPGTLASAIECTARMATPLSMLIMGMRLGTMKPSSLFTDIRVYITVAVKQFVMPLVAFALCMCLPSVSADLRRTLFIICACPIASVVLNFAEIIGEGQSNAANMVLVSTILSIVTLPVMMLLMPFIV
jgi:predicted permease